MTTLLASALTLSPFLVFLLIGTVNKSNVVTASTSIQLLDERKSPVVAGKQWISIDEYKVSMASTYLASELLLCTKMLAFEREKNFKLLRLQHAVISTSPRLWQLVAFDVKTEISPSTFIFTLWMSKALLVCAEENFSAVGSMLI